MRLLPASLVRRNRPVHVTFPQLIGLPDVRRFAAAQGAGQVFDAVLTVYLARHLLFINASGPTTTRLVQMALSALVPLLLAGPISGIAADRLTRRGILVSGHVIRAVLAACAVVGTVTERGWVLLMVWAAGMCMSRVLYTTRAVSVRHIVRQHEIVAADSLLLFIGGVSGVVGGSLGLLLERVVGTGAMWSVVAAHVVSAWLFGTVTANLGGGRDHTTAEWSVARGALVTPKIRYAMLATASHKFLLGCAFAATILLVDSRTANSAAAYASALGATGLGTLLGTPCAEWVNERLPRRSVTILAFVLASLSMTGGVAVDRRASYLAALAVIATLFQIMRVESDATIQANAPSGAGGRVFAAYDLSYNLSYIAGILAALFLSSASRPAAVLVSAATAYGVISPVFSLMSRESLTRPVSSSGRNPRQGDGSPART